MLLFLFLAGTLQAQEEIEDDVRYKKRVEKYISRWEKLIPHYTKLQFAGSMGMLSLGTGWNYYRNHWETDVYLGIVPRNSDRHAMATLTLKQNYYPWNIHIADKLSFEPLACGVYINTLLDRDFWGKQPDKYPQGYYWFSTRIRTHVFIGERFTLKLNTKKSWHKSISFFYELSTCDLYLINKIGNGYLKPKDLKEQTSIRRQDLIGCPSYSIHRSNNSGLLLYWLHNYSRQRHADRSVSEV